MRLCHGLLCERTATVWMRGKAWCVPCSVKRFGFNVAPNGAAPNGGPVLRRGGRLTTSTPPRLDAPPASLSADELLDILESDGWHDVEFDLWTRFGVDRNDIERMLERNIG